MSISGVSDGARERDLYNRQLREREEAHSKEVDYLQNQHKRSLKDLDEAQSKNVKVLQEKTSETLTKQAEEQTKQTQRLADRFERQAQLDNKSHYDKYGRAQRDHFQELKNQKDLLKEQLQNTIASDERRIDGIEKSRDQEIYNLRRQSTKEQGRVEDDTKKSLQRQADSFQRQMYEANREHGEKMNKQIRQGFEELRGNQNSANLRLEAVNNQHNNAEQNIKNAFSLREKQLSDEKTLRESQLDRQGSTSLTRYREKLGDNLARVQDDNNFYNAKKDIAYSNQLARQAHESKQQLQDQRMSFERRMIDDQGRSEANRDRDEIKNEIARRHAAHENYLNREALRSHFQDSIDHLKENHSGTLGKVSQEAQMNYEDTKRQFQKRLAKIEAERTFADQGDNFRALEKARQEQLEHLHQRDRMTKEFELAQASQDARVKRQKEATDSYNQQKSLDQYRKYEEQVARINSESASKLNMQRMSYESINKQIDAESKANHSLLEKSQKAQLDRITANHQATLIELSKAYENQMESMRREQTEALAKIRIEDDERLKSMMQDYEFKFRSLASEHDNKLTTLQQNQERELNSIKAEHDRQKREMQARAQADLQASQDTAKKALALQESQFKEKMRLSEENHKNEIARLKRSNELLSKKS